MTTPADPAWVTRTDHELRPDHTRVVSRIFLPGQEVAYGGESRSEAVLDRLLAMSAAEVDERMARLTARFSGRHYDLTATWEAHFRLLEHRMGEPESVGTERRLLIGAYFTQEYAFEAAALCNPSMVEHPDQSGLPAGSTRFVMTLRAVGEGHLSSVELRTGVIDSTDSLTFDPMPQAALLPESAETSFDQTSVRHQLRDLSGDRANADYVIDALPESFTRQHLDDALAELRDQSLTRGTALCTIERLERIAASTYTVRFPTASTMQERVIMPRGPSESHGIEDVRMLRFTEEDGSTRYLGTYTAYDGQHVSLGLIATDDFQTFRMEPLSGPGSRNKGLALFPRRVGGRYLALSRADRESNGVTTSTDLRHWSPPVLVQTPQSPWELIQLGNCGPPIETEAGWLVLTHGVGPMREYCLGALLLDVDDPTITLGRLATPLLSPAANERDGYVPNVVYSCGAMRHGRTLVLPYGCSDSRTRIANVDLDALLDALVA